MKILLVNKFYYHRGGAEVYMINLEELLKAKGHDVAVFAMQHPQGMESPFSKYFPANVEYGKKDLKQFRLLLTRPFGTKEVKRKFKALLDDFRPDVVHFNNIHTHLSPVIAQIAYEQGVRVVWTIHDMKIFCPDTLCLRRTKGQICELCFQNKKSVLKHRCNKDSFSASLIAYLEAKKWTREKLEKYTDVFICPSRFMAGKFIQGGVNKNKITVLCNFIDVEKTKRDHYDHEDYYCFVGRLSSEKGIITLVEAAKQLPYPLKIVGDGPLKEVLQQSVNEKIELLGHKNWDEIKNIVSKARFSVISSECYENNPLSVIESQCLGTPVLGSKIGGIPELIENGKTGLLFEARNVNDLKEKIEQMFAANFDDAAIAKESQYRYSAEKYYQEILNIYQNDNIKNI